MKVYKIDSLSISSRELLGDWKREISAFDIVAESKEELIKKLLTEIEIAAPPEEKA